MRAARVFIEWAIFIVLSLMVSGLLFAVVWEIAEFWRGLWS